MHYSSKDGSGNPAHKPESLLACLQTGPVITGRYLQDLMSSASHCPSCANGLLLVKIQSWFGFLSANPLMRTGCVWFESGLCLVCVSCIPYKNQLLLCPNESTSPPWSFVAWSHELAECASQKCQRASPCPAQGTRGQMSFLARCNRHRAIPVVAGGGIRSLPPGSSAPLKYQHETK